MQGANTDMRAEIDALQHHCNVLAGQNVELNTELERFVQTDEQIRTTLNRRDRVDNLRHQGDCKMRESYANLERASPRRRHWAIWYARSSLRFVEIIHIVCKCKKYKEYQH